MSDYIDRASIIEAIEECQTMTGEAKFVARILIYAEPSVDVQPVVHGHWRKMNYNLGYECSECGWEASNPWDFCPNCGARMVEDE